MLTEELREFLNTKVDRYNSPEFIESDPIQIPHQFSLKQDIEISGFLAATIAWGQRPTIIKNANRLMAAMDYAPYDFIKNHREEDLKNLEGFVHRTFNFDDLLFFMSSLNHIYNSHESLEELFAVKDGEINLKGAIGRFREEFFSIPHLSRTQKHLSDPLRNSACKRINMFLRWMVRNDNSGVDFGIWPSIPSSILSCPLDVHSGNVARHFGLLRRKQNDWKAVEELDESLRMLDPGDPVKYDFALFGMGVFENIR